MSQSLARVMPVGEAATLRQVELGNINPPELLTEQGRAESLAETPDEFVAEADQDWDDAIAHESRVREVWRDRQLITMASKLSKLLQLVSKPPPPTGHTANSDRVDPQGGLMMTVRDVAGALGVCTRTVRRLIAAGELPAPAKIGRTSKWFSVDIEKYLEKAKNARPDYAEPPLSRACV